MPEDRDVSKASDICDAERMRLCTVKEVCPAGDGGAPDSTLIGKGTGVVPALSSNVCGVVRDRGIHVNSNDGVSLFCDPDVGSDGSNENKGSIIGWTLFLVNGKGKQYRDELKFKNNLGFENNPSGYGGTASASLGDVDTAAGYKLSHNSFDAYKFDEILATYTDSNGATTSWLTIRRETPGKTFTAEMVYATHSLPPESRPGFECSPNSESNPRVMAPTSGESLKSCRERCGSTPNCRYFTYMHGYKGDVANERGWCTGCQYATPLAAQAGSYTDGDGKVHAYADTTTTYAIGERYMYTFNDGTTKTSDNNCVNTGNHRGYHRSIGPLFCDLGMGYRWMWNTGNDNKGTFAPSAQLPSSVDGVWKFYGRTTRPTWVKTSSFPSEQCECIGGGASGCIQTNPSTRVLCCTDDPNPVDPTTRGAKKFLLSAWIRVDKTFDGSTTNLLPTRWYDLNGDLIHDTLTPSPSSTSDGVTNRATLSLPRDGKWHRYEEEVEMPSSSSWLQVDVGKDELGVDCETRGYTTPTKNECREMWQSKRFDQGRATAEFAGSKSYSFMPKGCVVNAQREFWTDDGWKWHSGRVYYNNFPNAYERTNGRSLLCLGNRASYVRLFVGRMLGSSASLRHTKGTVDVTLLSLVVWEDNNLDRIDQRMSHLHRWRELGPGGSGALLSNPSAAYVAFAYRGSTSNVVETKDEQTTATTCCFGGDNNTGNTLNITSLLSTFGVGTARTEWRPWHGGVVGPIDAANNDGPRPLQCFRAELRAGTHNITGCRMTGVFLQRSSDSIGGSCRGKAGPSCPAHASGCRKKAGRAPGVLCFGCAVNSVTGEYTCSREGVIARVVSGAPPRFVHPSSMDLVINSNDRKCTNVTVTLDGVSLATSSIVTLTPQGDEEEGLVRIHLPTLPLGPHALNVRVSCVVRSQGDDEDNNEDDVVSTSKDLAIEWTVVDPRPTNTSIVGIDTTPDADVTFELTANKPGCSFRYRLDDRADQQVVGAGATDDALAARVVTSGIPPGAPWPRDALNVVFQSSRGSGVVFRSTLTKIGEAPVALPDVVAGEISRQGQLTLSGLEAGAQYDLAVDVQNGQAKLLERIVVADALVVEDAGVDVHSACNGVQDCYVYAWVHRPSRRLKQALVRVLGGRRRPADVDDGGRVVLKDLQVGVHTLTVHCEPTKRRRRFESQGFSASDLCLGGRRRERPFRLRIRTTKHYVPQQRQRPPPPSPAHARPSTLRHSPPPLKSTPSSASDFKDTTTRRMLLSSHDASGVSS